MQSDLAPGKSEAGRENEQFVEMKNIMSPRLLISTQTFKSISSL